MVLFIDCSAGASGDMLLAGMLDLGLPAWEVRECLQRLGLGSAQLRVERVRAGQIRASRARVRSPGGGTLPRGAGELIRRVRGSSLAPTLREEVARVLSRLASAEAAAHGVAPRRVWFHQLAGADMLAAVAGFCAGLRRFRVRATHVTPIPVGAWHLGHRGRWIPRPGPATLRLLSRLPVRRMAGRFEWTTPTAAALLAAFASPAPAPPLRVAAIGHAAGHRTAPGGPAFLTLLLGYPVG
ncbi:MAG: DUF111 family protein [Candidatus Omnitrophica bacterium]|nr:DUF111 family protein [Candidatus Omnitrophota bacterium]